MGRVVCWPLREKVRLTASYFEITGTRTCGYQTIQIYVDIALYMSLTQRDLDRYMYV